MASAVNEASRTQGGNRARRHASASHRQIPVELSLDRGRAGARTATSSMPNMRAMPCGPASPTCCTWRSTSRLRISRARSNSSGSSRRKPGSLIRGAISACRPEDAGLSGSARTRACRPLREGFPPRAPRRPRRRLARRALSRQRQTPVGHAAHLRHRHASAPGSRMRWRSSILRPMSPSSSTIAACPISRAAISTPGSAASPTSPPVRT